MKASRPRCFHRLCRHRAFTIVEVIVALAVIALLLGLLLPSLAGVRSRSRSSQCQSNLRQMATAAQAYAAIFDAFPTAIRYERIDGVFHHVSWDWVSAGSQVVRPGAIWMYTNNPGEAMQCPDYHGPLHIGEQYSGYNYNTCFIGGEANFPQIGWDAVRKGVRPHACHRSSQCAMFGDGGTRTQANRYMRAPLPNDFSSQPLSRIYSGAQAFRHDGSTNIAFVDGHVAARTEICAGQLATESLLSQMGYPQNGFLSQDNSAYDPR